MIEPSTEVIWTSFITAAICIILIITIFDLTSNISTAHSYVFTLNVSGTNTVVAPSLSSVGLNELVLTYASLPFLITIAFSGLAIDEVTCHD